MAEDEAEDKDSEPEEAPPARPRPTPRQSITRFLMFFLGILALYVLVFPDVSLAFGGAMGVALNPLIGFGGRFPVITILLAGLVTTTLSTVLRHFFTPWAKMARMNLVTASIRKEQMDALRKGNQGRIQRLRERQGEVMKEFMDVQMVPLKFMAYTMFFFVVFFSWLRQFVDVTLANQGNLYIAVPWSFNTYLPAIYVFPSWVLLYSLLAIPFGQVIQRFLKWFSFRRRLIAIGAVTELTAPEDVP